MTDGTHDGRHTHHRRDGYKQADIDGPVSPAANGSKLWHQQQQQPSNQVSKGIEDSNSATTNAILVSPFCSIRLMGE